jgi:hypothetical protein
MSLRRGENADIAQSRLAARVVRAMIAAMWAASSSWALLVVYGSYAAARALQARRRRRAIRATAADAGAVPSSQPGVAGPS